MTISFPILPSPEADKYQKATIAELIAMWKSLDPLDMVSHQHAAYARALCDLSARLERAEKVCEAAIHACRTMSAHCLVYPLLNWQAKKQAAQSPPQ